LCRERRLVRKSLLAALGLFVVMGLFATIAVGNPSMIPKHPGYPAQDVTSPVTGQPLANDPGQASTSQSQALEEAASSEDAHVSQNLLINLDNERLLEKPGAGVLPRVQGPEIKIEPVVKEATRMPQ
jgi:hypothetical protein